MVKKVEELRNYAANDDMHFVIVWAGLRIRMKKFTRGLMQGDDTPDAETLPLLLTVERALVEPSKNRMPRVMLLILQPWNFYNSYPKDAHLPKFRDFTGSTTNRGHLGGARVRFWGQRGDFGQRTIHHVRFSRDSRDDGEKDAYTYFTEEITSTIEWVVTGDLKTNNKQEEEWQTFALAGDSGAIVYTNEDPKNRIFIGMIRAGDDQYGPATGLLS